MDLELARSGHQQQQPDKGHLEGLTFEVRRPRNARLEIGTSRCAPEEGASQNSSARSRRHLLSPQLAVSSLRR